MQKSNTVIIGGGFSGLLISTLLEHEGIDIQLLEARHRLGGRIFTLRSKNGTSVEMGATWLGKKHNHLLNLLKDLKIEISAQHMGKQAYYEPMSVSPPQLVDLPPNDQPSYRIEGGSDRIIEVLSDHLQSSRIHLNQPVQKIKLIGDRFEVDTKSDCFEADHIISTLPPKLFIENIQCDPILPDEFIRIARKTHTWMADSIKIALTFPEPFWLRKRSSGTIFSNVGPIHEMYDHSGNGRYALKGFMNSAYHDISRAERKELVIEHLSRFYPKEVENYLAYHEMVWRKESFSYHPYDQPVIPHQHNGHAVFTKPFMDGRLFISGSETATEFPGYMDGAVESAYRTVEQLKKQL